MEQRRQYDREFKAQAVRLCEQEGVPITQIARELGIDVKFTLPLAARSAVRWQDCISRPGTRQRR